MAQSQRLAGDRLAVAVENGDLYAAPAPAEQQKPAAKPADEGDPVNVAGGPNCPCPRPGQNKRCFRWPCIFAGGNPPFDGRTPQLPQLG